jgi:hypothetical protein
MFATYVSFFFEAAGLRAVVFFEVDFLEVDFLEVVFAAVDFLAVVLSAVVLRAEVFVAVDPRAAVRVAGAVVAVVVVLARADFVGFASCLAARGGVSGAATGAGRPSQTGRCPIAQDSGCCARCGCSGPGSTWSFLIIARPKRFFGSIPRTAFSTANAGRRRRRSS